MYGTTYGSVYNPQLSIDRINKQIAELEKLKSQIPQSVPQPTNLTQNFQLAPNTREIIKYAVSLEEVQKETVLGETPFFSKDMSVVWIKNPKGDIKTYELNEIVSKDTKDIQIEYLQAQIEELRKEMRKNESNAVVNESASDSVKITRPETVSAVPESNNESKKSGRTSKANDK